LALKAFLALHGLTQDELAQKPYGHDLEALMNKAVQLGLRFDRHDTASQCWIKHTPSIGRDIQWRRPILCSWSRSLSRMAMTCSSLF